MSAKKKNGLKSLNEKVRTSLHNKPGVCAGGEVTALEKDHEDICLMRHNWRALDDSVKTRETYKTAWREGSKSHKNGSQVYDNMLKQAQIMEYCIKV